MALVDFVTILYHFLAQKSGGCVYIGWQCVMYVYKYVWAVHMPQAMMYSLLFINTSTTHNDALQYMCLQ